MKDQNEKMQYRQVGKGFILNRTEGMVGRVLTQTYVDQNRQTYVKVNGEFVPLTAEHCYLAVN